jgi:ElaB/YqjD/DUF883 family membrane-anchored ribosome-binding protein
MDQAANVSSSDGEDIASDLKQMVGDAEQLLKKAGQAGSREYDSALRKATEQLRRAKDEFLRLEGEAVLQAKYVSRLADQQVHQHPYVAMGLAASVGVLVGMLIARR